MDENLRKHDVFNSNHEPYWIVSTPDTDYPKLEENVKVDVAIVGGGIAGITSAFLLKRAGLKVAVIEANKIIKGTTGHTTAKISIQHGLKYDKLIKQQGEELARQYAEANQYAVHLIHSLSKEKGIDCDFEWQPAYVYARTDEYKENIENEVKAALRLGIKADYLEKIPFPFDIKAAVRFENQAQFHPRKYLLALAKDIPGDGSYIFENTTVVDIDDEEVRTVISRDGKKVTADKVIIASHFPCYDRMGLYFARMYQEKSYTLGITVKEKYPGGMYITAEDPGKSMRSQKFEDGELIILGGEHHKTGHETHTNVHYERLADFAKDTFTVEKFWYRWHTQDCQTLDSIPYIGHLTSKTENIYVATGFGKWGMTSGTISGVILTDLITKGESKWADVFNPSRTNITATAGNFVVQNLDVASQLVGGKLTPVPDMEEVEIKNGEAKIVNMDGERVGAYRDESGKLHIVDITCTHLGCELVWNEAEKTWDCPCHGSRFNYDGDVVDSPAFKPLRKPGEGKNKPDPNIF